MISIIFTLLITTARGRATSPENNVTDKKKFQKKFQKKRKLTPELFIKSLIAACIFYLLI